MGGRSSIELVTLVSSAGMGFYKYALYARCTASNKAASARNAQPAKPEIQFVMAPRLMIIIRQLSQITQKLAWELVWINNARLVIDEPVEAASPG